MEILEKLLGGAGKVKLMRLFIFNEENSFTIEEVAKKTRVSVNRVRKEIKSLVKVNFIKNRVLVREIKIKKGRKKISVKKKFNGFVFNPSFPFISQFKTMLLRSTSFYGDALIRKIGRAGRMKLIVTSGIFMQEPESRLDLMVVGDRFDKKILERTVKNIEAEIGREIRYAFFETPDFNYRLGVYDRLIRDDLDYPHEKLLNKIGVIG